MLLLLEVDAAAQKTTTAWRIATVRSSVAARGLVHVRRRAAPRWGVLFARTWEKKEPRKPSNKHNIWEGRRVLLQEIGQIKTPAKRENYMNKMINMLVNCNWWMAVHGKHMSSVRSTWPVKCTHQRQCLTLRKADYLQTQWQCLTHCIFKISTQKQSLWNKHQRQCLWCTPKAVLDSKKSWLRAHTMEVLGPLHIWVQHTQKQCL